jgi:hypothetical protein
MPVAGVCRLKSPQHTLPGHPGLDLIIGGKIMIVIKIEPLFACPAKDEERTQRQQ